MKKIHVLFICTHNSCRSQMAEGLLNHYCNDMIEAKSAGMKKTRIHPFAVKVMNEIDIDISHQYSKHVDMFKDNQFDYVVTVCDQAKETCPFFPGEHVIHKGFTDPGQVKGSVDDQFKAFRTVRDEIKEWIMETFCHHVQSSNLGG